MREAWGVLHPAVPFVDNWHLRLTCEHLQAITQGRLLELGLQNRLAINQPPGTMKSETVSVFWGAWEWGPAGMPHLQYLTATYREDYALRDSRKMRDLVASEWYQARWGDTVVLTSSMPSARRFENTRRGFRWAVPYKSLTAGRGNRVIIDDPHSVDTAESDAERNEVVRLFRESVPSRVNDPMSDAIVVVMHRLHQNDICGAIEDLGLPYVRVTLPMEFEAERRCVTPIGRDPRTYDGELLFPERWPTYVVERDKKATTAYAWASQYQQRPGPRQGNMFLREWMREVRACPATAIRVRGWDLAATKAKARANPAASGPAYTAGVRMSYLAGLYIVEHVERLRGTPGMVEARVKTTARRDDAEFGRPVRLSVPQDPGQAGVSQKAAYAKNLAGHDIRFSPETGDKVDRANPLSAQAEVGNLAIVRSGDPDRDAWIEPFIDELCGFPSSRYKDQVDAASRAFAELQRIINATPDDGDIGEPVGVPHG